MSGDHYPTAIDCPAPSADFWQQAPLSHDDLVRTNRQLRKDLVTIGAQRDGLRALLAERVEEIAGMLETIRTLHAEVESWKGIAAEMASDMGKVARFAGDTAARWQQ